MPISAKFDLARSNGSVFSDSLRNDVIMFGGDSSQHILIGTKDTDGSGNPLPASISIDSSSTSAKTSFRTPVDIDNSLNVKSNVLVTNNGSLGIGTTNPSEKLDVVGNVKATTFIGDGSQLTGVNSSEGNVVGPTSSLDNEIPRFDGTTGDLLQGSSITVTDAGAIVAPQASSIIPFYHDQKANLPSASTYHGAIAHAHDTGNMYYAHAGEWKQLANNDILEAFKLNDAATTLAVGHNSTSSYTFAPQYVGDNPTLRIVSGETIAFDLTNISGHPFEILEDVDGTLSLFNTGLRHVATDGTVLEGSLAQGKDSGILFWRVPESLTGSYKYRCSNHPSTMVGIIDVFRLVDNQLINVAKDVQIETSATIVSLAGGENHSLALDSEGNVYAWGDNQYGQLGTGSTPVSVLVPVLVDFANTFPNVTITAIAVGDNHGLALDSTGNVYAWGRNNDGQLGNNNTGTDSFVPVLVDFANTFPNVTITAIAAGGNHSLSLDSTGNVYAWGLNDSGQLGNNNTGTNSAVPVLVDFANTFPNVTIKALAAGGHHSLVIDSAGKVYAWGINNYGQLGNDSTTDSPVPVLVDFDNSFPNVTITALAAGGDHSLALDSGGNVYAWGYNANGQLGNDNTGTNSLVPVLSDFENTFSNVTITAVSAGLSHSLVIDSAGKVYAWGINNYGQLGNDSTTDSPVPVLVDFANTFPNVTITAILGDNNGSHNLAIDTAGNVYAWGHNNLGQLGDDTTVQKNTPVDIGKVTTYSEITDVLSIGNGNPIVISTGSQDRLYIESDTGNVGIGTTTPTQKLHVIGTILASKDITSTSDVRMKEDIRKIEDSLEKIRQLNGYTFLLKGDAKEKRRMGVIAQELLEVIPEVVHEDASSGLLSVAYGNMMGMMIEGMKDLARENGVLSKSMEDLKLNVNDLKLNVNDLKLRVEELERK